MAKAEAGYAVRRVSGNLCDVLLQQHANLAEAIAYTDDPNAVRLLSIAISQNADVRSVLTLIEANQVPKAEMLTRTLSLLREHMKAKKKK